MNKVKYIIPVILLLALLSGCKTTMHTNKKGAFLPKVDAVRLNMTMDDFEIAGESEISISYYRYFGFITVIDEVNGVRYDPYNEYKTDIKGLYFGASKLKKSASKIVEEIPDASWYQLVYEKKKVERLMFGRRVNQSALIRGYNIKYSNNK